MNRKVVRVIALIMAILMFGSVLTVALTSFLK